MEKKEENNGVKEGRKRPETPREGRIFLVQLIIWTVVFFMVKYPLRIFFLILGIVMIVQMYTLGFSIGFFATVIAIIAICIYRKIMYYVIPILSTIGNLKTYPLYRSTFRVTTGENEVNTIVDFWRVKKEKRWYDYFEFLKKHNMYIDGFKEIFKP